MQYRADLKSGNELSALGFGCMRFPTNAVGRIDVEATERLILAARDAGINYFDTAYLYHGNEEALGEIFARNQGLRERLFIASKLPHLICETRTDFERFLGIQKQRLRTNYLDYYLIHNVSSLAQWERLVALGIETWIEAKKDSGEVRRIGFSFHGPEAEFTQLLDAYAWDFCQIQYNYLHEHYQAGTAGLAYAASKGLPVIVMEPLLGGLLATGLPPAAREAIEAAEAGSSPVSWALRWVWNHPEVTVVLSGMNSLEQLAENEALAKRALPHAMSASELATIERVRDIFAESYRVPCTGCNYCMPCPKGVNIPACFAAYNASYAHGWFEGMRQYVMGTGALDDNAHLASDCVRCGACEKLCPQHIAIPEALQDVRKRLQPFFMLPALNLGKKFRMK